ncbi:unnamed protein product [Urochloa decumbens]|uniref:Uncharacterized protein n=1 Tax=Urochloa decumbens TaxID=240449 RepID=A0ABC9AN97_9POAL
MTDNVVDALRVAEPTIHRFPQNLRRIGTERDYIVPRSVALGPYYHGVAELGAMEEVKLAAVGYFFEGLAGESREEAYKKIFPIACSVRSCYADASALKGITDDEFATMMFVDGCFLVQFMITVVGSRGDKLRSLIQPHLLWILRDVMLLENQIPWPVVQFLIALKGLPISEIVDFLASCLHGTLASGGSIGVDIDEESRKPSHLLCLVLSNIVGHSRRRGRSHILPGMATVKASTSAAELAEIGIKLRACEMTAKFSAMGIVEGPFFAQLSLVPLLLQIDTASWLVNMAAFEMYTESMWTDDCSINSYLAVVSLLITRKEDVRELRTKGIVQGFSDQGTLDFFDGLSTYLCACHAYEQTIVDLEDYKRKRWLWIAVYRFLYSNARTIATVLSVVGVLVGIFKAIFSLKQH